MRVLPLQGVHRTVVGSIVVAIAAATITAVGGGVRVDRWLVRTLSLGISTAIPAVGVANSGSPAAGSTAIIRTCRLVGTTTTISSLSLLLLLLSDVRGHGDPARGRRRRRRQSSSMVDIDHGLRHLLGEVEVAMKGGTPLLLVVAVGMRILLLPLLLPPPPLCFSYSSSSLISWGRVGTAKGSKSSTLLTSMGTQTRPVLGWMQKGDLSK
mmetsp:Transcript_31485/g.92332  ORF Transcript_31485/g.92332 Transcript_31485/m.92332 type:complete len:210 (-) Transcript_31485:1327-1956(-)